MKSRILKAVAAVVVPIIIEFVIKKVSERFDKKSNNTDSKKYLPSSH